MHPTPIFDILKFTPSFKRFKLLDSGDSKKALNPHKSAFFNSLRCRPERKGLRNPKNVNNLRISNIGVSLISTF